MPLSLSFFLGILFAFLAFFNASLAAWLWTFPMAPDPDGPDPNGKSTAPPRWTKVHRFIGIVFIVIYLALMAEMIPRLWEHKAGLEGLALIHGVLGLAIGPLLLAKILIIRRFQKHGKKLPLLGGAIAGAAMALVALVAMPAAKVTVVFPQTRAAAFFTGQKTVSSKCQQCHGSSTILREARPVEDWQEVFEEMLEESGRLKPAVPLDASDEEGVVHFLSERAGASDEGDLKDRGHKGKSEDDDEEGEDSRDRRRGR